MATMTILAMNMVTSAHNDADEGIVEDDGNDGADDDGDSNGDCKDNNDGDGELQWR